jgi:pantoate--beta-alanine ligase
MTMLTITDVEALRAELARWHGADRVALVPTMGNLHVGHASLIGHARTLAARVVVSIFVNPLQFDREEDLAAYPRTLKEDCSRLRELDVDILFLPSVEAMYPRGMESATRVEVPHLSGLLEGEKRPGHFIGVATVVTKLLNMVQPDVAVFGEKDYQQLLIIQQLVTDLNLPVEIVGLPTVREPDGLAMSSRNRRLTAEERAQAPGLFRAVRRVGAFVAEGRRDYEVLEHQAVQDLERLGFRPDYVSVRRASDLGTPGGADRDLVVVAAAWLGRTRLIDNIRVTRPHA